MTIDKFDKKAGNALRRYEAEPPADMFARIAGSLDALAHHAAADSGNEARLGGGMPPHDTAAGAPVGVPTHVAKTPDGVPGATVLRRRKTAVWRYGAAAAVFLGLLTAAFLITNRGVETPLQVADGTPVAVPAVVDASSLPDSALQAGVGASSGAERAVDVPLVTTTITSAPHDVVTTTPRSVATIIRETEHTPVEPAPAVVPDTETVARPGAARHPAERRTTNITPLSPRLELEDTPEIKRGRLVASLYGGSGGNGNLRTADLDRIYADRMFIKQSLSMAPASSPGDGALSDPSPLAAAPEGELRHNMPVSFGLGLAMPLTHRLSLHSGVNYSYLYSVSTQTRVSEQNRLTREIHYLGVPLSLSYSFYKRGNVDLYIRGGGMIEKAVYFRQTQYFDTGGDTGGDGETRGVKGVQLSVDGSVGFTYNLGGRLGLYVEPGVAYYFDQGQPANYRTANPTSFSLRVGLRFGL